MNKQAEKLIKTIGLPIWMHTAINELGTSEIPGPESNQQIKKYLEVVDLSHYDDSEISWCAAFVAWVLKESGYEYLSSPAARAWISHGIFSPEPFVGCIVILWRESITSWKGHIGFCMGVDYENDCIYILGGNQNNTVSIQKFPIDRVLDIRIPKKVLD